MFFHPEGPPAFFLILVLVVRDAEFIQAVVQDDSGKSVDMDPVNAAHTDRSFQFAVQSAGAEIRVVHKVAELIGLCRFAGQHFQHLLFRDLIPPAQFLRDVMRKDLCYSAEFLFIERIESLPCLISEDRKGIRVMEGDVRDPLAALPVVHLKIGDDLLEGQFERIADVVKERGQSPELQEQVGRPPLLSLSAVRIQAVEFTEFPAVDGVGLIDRKSEREHVDGMGIVVPVLHEKRTAVGLELGEELHHLLGFAVMPEKDIQIAVIYVVGILCNA